MINPFQYGGVVADDAFCNRRSELTDLQRAMENGETQFVYSERRMGKTSLMTMALSRLPKDQYLSAYVDLWATDGEGSFATATARAITHGMATTADKLLKAAKAFFGRLTPTISTDSAGNPQVSFELGRSAGPGPELDEVLSAPARIAAQRGRRIVMVFDEFQRVLEYETDLVERKLRGAVQTQQQVAYIFLGSRKHLLQEMFLSQSRPLYRAGGHYPLGPITVQDWLPFIRARFQRSGKEIGDLAIRSICQMTGGHPFYTQHLCHAIWELCEVDGQVSETTIRSAVDLLLDRESYAYTALWESLARNQRRLLAGLAAEAEGVQVYSSRFLREHHLRSPSNAQRAIEALLKRDIVDRGAGSYIITDRFFKLWINTACTPP
jgi:AAA+ ATPase superfamily predicted ATPase